TRFHVHTHKFLLHVSLALAVNTLKYTVGDSVTLQTGVTALNEDDRILWKFNSVIAEMNIKIHEITLNSDDIFRGRLHLENQTGSLTIRDIRTSDAGVYQLQISNSKETLYKRFNVFVVYFRCSLIMKWFVCLSLFSCSRSGSVHWLYCAHLSLCPAVSGCSFGCNTGDLTISDIRIPISGDYQMKITGSKAKNKRFKVIVRGDVFKIFQITFIIISFILQILLYSF
uniref:Immunoglobulin domain-containing protein n=1 Tax=Cyprinus carpio TaxID=7962 RepID=A0A8C1SHK3_CYPCA